jgi:hypothetical protein
VNICSRARTLTYAALFLSTSCAGFAGEDALASSFRNPPDSAKPHTWWHWMNGNVTREGITADLEAMKSAGLGGAQMFSVGEKIPAGPVGYMSPQWREMVVHAVKEADRLGLELCIHNCPGWSSSAGPWIDPAHAMQVIAWSDRQVHGPAHVQEKLPPAKPPQVLQPVDYHKDIAVLAFPTSVAGEKLTSAKKLLGKTGVTRQNLPDPEIDPADKHTAISPATIVDLTSNLDANGVLTWDAPAGDWSILRIGYTPTGAKNKAAPAEGLGLEVDKLSREALDVHWNGMMAKVIADVGPLAGKVLNNALIDSYEVGDQNWTPKFREEFLKRRGYDLLKYLPIITGRTVGSTEESERFLWDFRRTIADLYADNYFGYFGELCHKHGMQFSTEPYGNGGFDNLQCGGLADIPMGEFWVGGHYLRSNKLAASAAHTNGRKFVGAEAFTASLAGGRFQLDPYSIKALGDQAFCNGINRYVFHRYAHQPWLDLQPGMTMGKWGMHLERTETWWKEAAAWFHYISRAQYLLQEGRFVADALYYNGEGAPSDLPERDDLKPALPEGYDYDGCDATALLNRVSTRDGKIVLPNGASYRVLLLPDSEFMTPRIARKVRELVQAGASVVGLKPTQSPSLSGYPKCDSEVQSIANEVWGAADGARNFENSFGSGRVFWGKPITKILNVPPDFSYRATSEHAKLAYLHRQMEGADAYFVSSQLYQCTAADCAFRVTGRAPEIWNPETGGIMPAPVYREENGQTVVSLQFEPAQSLFVVFRSPANPQHITNVQLVSAHVPPTPPLHSIAVQKAVYETTDSLKSIDVTSTVSRMLADGQINISATTEYWGDPGKGLPKQLHIEYKGADGKPTSSTAGERAVIFLADIARTASLPQYQLRGSTTGTELLAWQTGTLNYSSAGTTKSVEIKEPPRVVDVSGTWAVTFPPNLGAPDSITMQHLTSWTDNPSSGVRYFSGTATYSIDFEVTASALTSTCSPVLDLGVVKNFATVRLNNTDLGVVWKAPYRLDAAAAVKPGRNHLEVKVTNLWPNRLIGDEQFPPDAQYREEGNLAAWPDWLANKKPRPGGRVAFSTWKFYDKDDQPMESGLIGPVSLKLLQAIPLP